MRHWWRLRILKRIRLRKRSRALRLLEPAIAACLLVLPASCGPFDAVPIAFLEGHSYDVSCVEARQARLGASLSGVTANTSNGSVPARRMDELNPREAFAVRLNLCENGEATWLIATAVEVDNPRIEEIMKHFGTKQ